MACCYSSQCRTMPCICPSANYLFKKATSCNPSKCTQVALFHICIIIDMYKYQSLLRAGRGLLTVKRDFARRMRAKSLNIIALNFFSRDLSHSPSFLFGKKEQRSKRESHPNSTQYHPFGNAFSLIIKAKGKAWQNEIPLKHSTN